MLLPKTSKILPDTLESCCLPVQESFPHRLAPVFLSVVILLPRVRVFRQIKDPILFYAIIRANLLFSFVINLPNCLRDEVLGYSLHTATNCLVLHNGHRPSHTDRRAFCAFLLPGAICFIPGLIFNEDIHFLTYVTLLLFTYCLLQFV